METKVELQMGDCAELLAACAREIGINLDALSGSPQRDALLGLLEAAAIEKIRTATESTRRMDEAIRRKQLHGLAKFQMANPHASATIGGY